MRRDANLTITSLALFAVCVGMLTGEPDEEAT